ncbi:hypothetical protein [Teredinibacter purpureus]|uniref:hypothetical protein n=1 Tax=Teredinibacter purpureus TaxID=2731756 RepID=UPI0005F838CA|nr:hypothetical protein [Teredinibacter purpureus]
MSSLIHEVVVGFFEKRQGESGESIEPMFNVYSNERSIIQFTFSDDANIFTWKHEASATSTCLEDGHEDGHLHWNAAAGMFYRDGVFSWEEYGPTHSEAEAKDLATVGNGGVRKAVTHGHGGDFGDYGYFFDHSGILLKIISVKK